MPRRDVDRTRPNNPPRTDDARNPSSRVRAEQSPTTQPSSPSSSSPPRTPSTGEQPSRQGQDRPQQRRHHRRRSEKQHKSTPDRDAPPPQARQMSPHLSSAEPRTLAEAQMLSALHEFARGSSAPAVATDDESSSARLWTETVSQQRDNHEPSPKTVMSAPAPGHRRFSQSSQQRTSGEMASHSASASSRRSLRTRRPFPHSPMRRLLSGARRRSFSAASIPSDGLEFPDDDGIVPRPSRATSQDRLTAPTSSGFGEDAYAQVSPGTTLDGQNPSFSQALSIDPSNPSNLQSPMQPMQLGTSSTADMPSHSNLAASDPTKSTRYPQHVYEHDPVDPGAPPSFFARILGRRSSGLSSNVSSSSSMNLAEIPTVPTAQPFETSTALPATPTLDSPAENNPSASSSSVQHRNADRRSYPTATRQSQSRTMGVPEPSETAVRKILSHFPTVDESVVRTMLRTHGGRRAAVEEALSRELTAQAQAMSSSHIQIPDVLPPPGDLQTSRRRRSATQLPGLCLRPPSEKGGGDGSTRDTRENTASSRMLRSSHSPTHAPRPGHSADSHDFEVRMDDTPTIQHTVAADSASLQRPSRTRGPRMDTRDALGITSVTFSTHGNGDADADADAADGDEDTEPAGVFTQSFDSGRGAHARTRRASEPRAGRDGHELSTSSMASESADGGSGASASGGAVVLSGSTPLPQLEALSPTSSLEHPTRTQTRTLHTEEHSRNSFTDVQRIADRLRRTEVAFAQHRAAATEREDTLRAAVHRVQAQLDDIEQNHRRRQQLIDVTHQENFHSVGIVEARLDEMSSQLVERHLRRSVWSAAVDLVAWILWLVVWLFTAGYDLYAAARNSVITAKSAWMERRRAERDAYERQQRQRRALIASHSRATTRSATTRSALVPRESASASAPASTSASPVGTPRAPLATVPNAQTNGLSKAIGYTTTPVALRRAE